MILPTVHDSSADFSVGWDDKAMPYFVIFALQTAAISSCRANCQFGANQQISLRMTRIRADNKDEVKSPICVHPRHPRFPFLLTAVALFRSALDR
jgi:hypothetical protein